MSDEKQQPEGDEEPKKGKMGMIIVPVLVAVSAAGGFAVPRMMGGEEKPAVVEEEVVEKLEIPDPTGEPAFVEFDSVVANLNDGRMTRYLKLGISLQVDKGQLVEIEKLNEEREAIMRNWILSHLADKSMDDIRGRNGQNRLRAEIKDQFNAVLFADGIDRVHDVLFQEFNVQ